jgi:hypothetical protein
MDRQLDMALLISNGIHNCNKTKHTMETQIMPSHCPIENLGQSVNTNHGKFANLKAWDNGFKLQFVCLNPATSSNAIKFTNALSVISVQHNYWNYRHTSHNPNGTNQFQQPPNCILLQKGGIWANIRLLAKWAKPFTDSTQFFTFGPILCTYFHSDEFRGCGHLVLYSPPPLPALLLHWIHSHCQRIFLFAVYPTVKSEFVPCILA